MWAAWLVATTPDVEAAVNSQSRGVTLCGEEAGRAPPPPEGWCQIPDPGPGRDRSPAAVAGVQCLVALASGPTGESPEVWQLRPSELGAPQQQPASRSRALLCSSQVTVECAQA